MEKFYEKPLLDELHEIQNTYGYIPEEQIIRIAKKRGMPKSELYGVITFYSMFHTKPRGRYIIRVCNSLSCHLNNSKNVVEMIKEYLGIDSGETTKDRKFTLEIVECLGHCGEGPVMMINNKIYTKVTPQQAVSLLKDCI
ncbi:NADH dehydrogenase [Marinitoga sp. 1135]|uniref:NADH-quinone oxidoreductase subunit NuoE n=1 Tax=unclassified Marinitoga TaxID=2640159 RepID=UPI0009506609|nr:MULTISPECIES: NADH-quinone oxidoreductase subunit NuoE [unclassified Marinitoga]APT75901.1 NADH dehydrogenase [Marinitoga sp. 1137]NUU95560.1 NADH dehydrogenase [Marinitoga sp. 1135]NUU97566.1 NADH dehydrogenase [Marinitoga sp. 1138]